MNPEKIGAAAKASIYLQMLTWEGLRAVAIGINAYLLVAHLGMLSMHRDVEQDSKMLIEKASGSQECYFWPGKVSCLKYSERNCKKRLLRSKNEFRFKFNEIRWRHQHSQRFSIKKFRQKQQINLVWIGSFAQCFIVNLDSHDSV